MAESKSLFSKGDMVYLIGLKASQYNWKFAEVIDAEKNGRFPVKILSPLFPKPIRIKQENLNHATKVSVLAIGFAPEVNQPEILAQRAFDLFDRYHVSYFTKDNEFYSSNIINEKEVDPLPVTRK